MGNDYVGKIKPDRFGLTKGRHWNGRHRRHEHPRPGGLSVDATRIN